MTSKAELLEAVTLTAKLAVGYPEDFNRQQRRGSSGFDPPSGETVRAAI